MSQIENNEMTLNDLEVNSFTPYQIKTFEYKINTIQSLIGDRLLICHENGYSVYRTSLLISESSMKSALISEVNGQEATFTCPFGFNQNLTLIGLEGNKLIIIDH